MKIAFLIFLSVFISCSRNRNSEMINEIDEYLLHWDNFAQGNEDAAYINNHHSVFTSNSIMLLKNNDKRIIPRIVFYVFVQVGGYIPVNSKLGKTFIKATYNEILLETDLNGDQILFCSDMYYWWSRNRSKYPEYELLNTWLGRDFAKNTVIPMYKALNDERYDK